MLLKLNIIGFSAWALSLSPTLAQSDGYCYDAEQHPVKFSDLGTRLDLTQALNETCGTPIGDHLYECNAAVCAQAKEEESNQGHHASPTHLSVPSNYIYANASDSLPPQKALSVHMPNNDPGTFVFHFANLHYVNQSIPDNGPCGDVYLSHASCVYLGLAAIDTCERGGKVTINETVAADGGGGRPVTAWLQVIPFI